MKFIRRHVFAILALCGGVVVGWLISVAGSAVHR